MQWAGCILFSLGETMWRGHIIASSLLNKLKVRTQMATITSVPDAGQPVAFLYRRVSAGGQQRGRSRRSIWKNSNSLSFPC